MTETTIPDWCRVGYYIDVKDHLNDWCMAYVKDTTQTTVKVSLDGYGLGWDYTFALNSPKIAPFRRHTHCYTGPKRSTMRDWMFSEEEVSRTLHVLRNLLEGSMLLENSFYTTQFYRGTLFVLVENLINNDYSENQQALNSVVELFSQTIRLIVKWFKNGSDLFFHYYRGVSNPDLYLTDNCVALAMSWPEICELLNELFALRSRVTEFFMHYDVVPAEYEPCSLSDTNNDKYSASLLYLINLFAKEGGFHAILDLIRNQEEDKKAPFGFINSILVYAVSCFLSPEFSQEFFGEFTKVILQRIEILSDSELKDLKTEEVTSLLQSMNNLSASFSAKSLELNKLKLYLRMLKSNYLEKRIKGLNEINSSLESLLSEENSCLAVEDLSSWIVDEEVVETILNERPHIELIKRSRYLLMFMAKYKLIKKQHLWMLWNCCSGKHDSLVRVTYNIISEISTLLSEAQNDYIFTRILEVPQEDYDEVFLQLVKDFTFKAIYVASRNSEFNSKWYGVHILKELMLDSNKLGMWGTATKHFTEVMKMPFCQELRLNFLREVPEYIARNNSVPQILKFFMGLFKGRLNILNQEEDQFTLEEKSNLKNLVLGNLIDYLTEARTQATDNNQDSVLVGRFSHETNIKKRLEFLEFLFQYSATQVKVQIHEYESLWRNFVESPVMNKDTETFYIWLTKGIKNQSPVTVDQCEEFFERFYLNDLKMPSEKINTTAFLSFRWLFLKVNSLKGNIVGEERFKLRKTTKCEGFAKLVDICLYSPDQFAVQESSKLIIGLVTRLERTIIEDSEKILSEFTQVLIQKVKAESCKEQIVEKGLRLLKLLLNEEEAPNKATIVYVKEVKSKEFKQVPVDMNKNIRHLRKCVADFFQQPLNKTTLYIHDKQYGSTEDDIELKSIKLYWLTADFNQDQLEEFSPKVILSKKQEIVDFLFTLLKYSDKSYAELSWNLLMTLPINEKVEQKLMRIDEPLEQLIDQSSMHKLLYSLTILEKLSKNEEWLVKFCGAGGTEFLVKTFLGSVKSTGKLAVKGNILMIKLFNRVFQKNFSLESVDSKNFTSALLRSFLLLCEEFSSENYVEEPENVFLPFINLIELVNQFDPQGLKTTSLSQNYLESLIEVVFFKELNKQCRLQAARATLELTKLASIHLEMLETLQAFLNRAMQSSCEEYWVMKCLMLREIDSHPSIQRICSQLIEFVSETQGENTSTESKVPLSGALMVLAEAWLKSSTQASSAHLDLILHRCLFEIPESASTLSYNPPKCKHISTRTQAFSLLLHMCKGNSKFLEEVTQYLGRFHHEPHWRSSRKADWNNCATSKEKSKTGFVGLKNLGCTCYMNSVLQQLFTISSFRESILQSPVKEPLEENLLYELQYIFSSLKYSAKQYINTKGFTSAFKDFEGNPVNVMEQMDADEFFSTFMDRIEELLKGSSNEELIKNHFGGLQVTEIIGKDCGHRSERLEPFLTVPLEVKNKKSIIEGLESFVEGELLEGENAYQCDQCQDKVRALRRVCIKQLPNYLLVALRRFEFDFDTMNRHKLNDYCEFPMSIDMQPFTQEGLEHLEKLKESKAELPEVHPASYYNYKLRGVVVHIGTAESGHYYSYIYDKVSGKWFEFNDILIQEINPEEIPAECFGGEEKWNLGGGPTTRQKFGNAYLVLYEREQFYKADKKIEPFSLEVKEALTTEHFSHVKEQNQRYWRSRLIFGDEYAKFVSEMTSLELPPKKFLAEFLLTVLIRSREKKQELVKVSKFLKQALKDTEFAAWMSEVLSVDQLIKELFLYCPVSIVRSLLVGLVKETLKCVPEQTEQFFTRWIQNLPYADKKVTKYFSQYLEVLLEVIKINKELVSKYRVIHLLQLYFCKNELKNYLPEPAEYTRKDIFLGYDNYTEEPEPVKDEAIFSDLKGTSYGNLFLLLLQQLDQFTQEELEFMQREDVIEYLFKEVDTKLSAKYFGHLYSKICSNNEYLSQFYLKLLMDNYERAESYLRTKYQKIVTPFLANQDTFQQPKIEEFIKRFFSIIKTSKYSTEVEDGLKYLFKLASKIPVLLSALQAKREDLEMFKEWIEKNMKVVFKPANSQQDLEESIRPGYKSLHSKCLRLLEGQCPNETEDWDSDEDLNASDFSESKEIDTTDNTGCWTLATIKADLGKVLWVEYKGYTQLHEVWREKHSDELAPAYTRSKPKTN